MEWEHQRVESSDFHCSSNAQKHTVDFRSHLFCPIDLWWFFSPEKKLRNMHYFFSDFVQLYFVIFSIEFFISFQVSHNSLRLHVHRVEQWCVCISHAYKRFAVIGIAHTHGEWERVAQRGSASKRERDSETSSARIVCRLIRRCPCVAAHTVFRCSCVCVCDRAIACVHVYSCACMLYRMCARMIWTNSCARVCEIKPNWRWWCWWWWRWRRYNAVAA